MQYEMLAPTGDMNILRAEEATIRNQQKLYHPYRLTDPGELQQMERRAFDSSLIAKKERLLEIYRSRKEQLLPAALEVFEHIK
mmetsp:Transcript_12676/g.9207  ORF Transcript_12676/g.9207 Transcript_12676/m.9207 type:complete len:83 (+) Transcript_12676:354-602(+)